MERPEFDIRIAPDGAVTVRVSGVSGDRCIELSDMLRDIIGRETSRELTGEFYGPRDGKVRISTQVRDRTGP